MMMVIAAFVSGYLVNELLDVRQAQRVLTGDRLPLFWEAWDKIEGNYLGELPAEQQVVYGAIRGSLGTLGDPYTVFLEPVVRQEERDTLRGNFGGIGVTLSRDSDGQVRIEPLPDNPAAAAGIRSGDILVAIDDRPVTNEQSIGELDALLRGEKGSQVALAVIQAAATAPVTINVVRADILIPSVTYRPLREEPAVGYIQLTRFSGESGSEVAHAIESLLAQGANRFVLDLRGNGGGLLDATVDVAGQFMADSVVYYQVARAADETVARTAGNPLLPDAPLVVLVDGGTASSAEIVAGALQDNQRAVLIGEPTFGKGSMQLVYDLSDGSSVHVTWARWLTPDRRQIDPDGLQPDFVLSQTQEARDSGRDLVLEGAIAYLKTTVTAATGP